MEFYSKQTTTRTTTRKNSIKKGEGRCQRFLKYITGDIKIDDEELSAEEIDRRYKMAMRGWKKVKKLVNTVKMYKRDKTAGNVSSATSRIPWYAYSRLVIYPTSRFKFIWNVLLSFLLLYHFLMFPLRVAYTIHSEAFKIIDIVIDIFFVFDLIFHFFYAYNTKKQKLIKQFAIIALRYIKSMYFFFDFFALCPYYWIQDDIYWFKVLRLLRFFEALRGFDIFSREAFLKLTSNINFTISMTRILK